MKFCVSESTNVNQLSTNCPEILCSIHYDVMTVAADRFHHPCIIEIYQPGILARDERKPKIQCLRNISAGLWKVTSVKYSTLYRMKVKQVHPQR